VTIYYVDSSAIVKFYIAESGSEWVRDLFISPATEVLYTTILSRIEVVAALARRMRTGELVKQSFEVQSTQFEEDFSDFFTPLSVSENILNVASQLLRKHNLRGYDALQFASAAEMNRLLSTSGISGLVFISADDQLNAVATAEGLPVENPNHHPSTNDVETPPARSGTSE
jgi:uncharacterized protein